MTGPDGGKESHEPVAKPGQTGISGAEFAGAGFQFAAILVLSSFAGMWVDRQIGTSPWMLIVLVFLGAAAAFYSFYQKLLMGQRLGERRKAHERREDED